MGLSLAPLSILNKAKFGVGGVLGIVVGTVVIEFVTQFLERSAPASVQNFLDSGIINNVPFLGRVDVRDLMVLGFSIKQILGLILRRGGKFNIMNFVANFGTKVVLRQQGINPLPDKHINQTKFKNFSSQLVTP